VTATLWRASLRYGLRHPWQFGLSLVGIALGVAVVVSIDLSIASARQAFVLSNQAVLGASTHRLRAGPAGVDERLYARLRTELPGLRAAPVVEGFAAGADGVALRVLGIDPFAEAPFRPRLERSSVARGEVLTRLLTRSGAVLVSAATAARLGIDVGDAFTIVISGRGRALELAALLEVGDALAAASLSDVIVTDIASAQELLDRVGRLSRVDVIADAGEAQRIAARLPAGVRLERAGSGSRFAERMTGSFNLNLVMLGLLALMVGMFLVYNTVTFSVVQRRALIGQLRATGVTRAQIFVLILSEAALVALLAVAAGLALGVLLAEQLVGLVSRTINDLYFQVTVRTLTVPPLILAKAALVGLVAALVAATMPALEATRVAPRAAMARSLLEVRMRRRLPRVSFAGGASLLLAALLVWLPGGLPELGFAALFAFVCGCALLAPGATLALLAVLRPVSTWSGGWLGRLALRGVAAHLSRTAVAIAALMVALSATVGVGVMVDSFRRSVSSWLDLTMRADMYVGLPGTPGERALDPQIMARVAALPGVADVSTGRGVHVVAELDDASQSVELVALGMARGSYAGFHLLAGDAARVWPAYDAGGAVIVSESFARRASLAPGARVRLQTDGGVHAFLVAAVFRDYGSEHGTIVMSRSTYDRHWDDPIVSTLGIYAADGVDSNALRDSVGRAIGGHQQLEVRDTRAIKSASMEVFDRTFTITAVLRGLATIIAFVGILSALMALQLERAKEVAVLRAQGLTPGQVWQLVQTQTGVMGLIAGVLSLPVGAVMALLLILVINLRSFGWSMDVHVDPMILLQAMGLALAAALIAGIYPAYRMAKISPAGALRED
jgi:putative ABC transport system permease protein